ncbi:MAG: hypothetical protein ACK41F_09870 [Fimbriimonadaceae bacterium]
MDWSQLLAVLATFVASSFALVRFSLVQQRQVADRFVGFLEEMVRRQEEAQAAFAPALSELAEAVRRNTEVLERMRGRTAGR